MSKRFAILCSTGGSVIDAVYRHTNRDDFHVDLVITDRECGVVGFAEKNNIPLSFIAPDHSAGSASAALQTILDNQSIDYLYVFYTRLLSGEVVEKYKNRLINFHPSLLPACPGLNGFEDTVKSGALIAGSTAHFIDQGMDTGLQIMQTFAPTLGVSSLRLRHIIFAQQCASIYQIHKMLQKGIDLRKLDVESYSLAQGFVPNIDSHAEQLYRKILG